MARDGAGIDPTTGHFGRTSEGHTSADDRSPLSPDKHGRLVSTRPFGPCAAGGREYVANWGI
jgi:hypothetical protein